MAKYYFIRHAESLANTQGIYQGQTYNTGLSVRGKKQAELLAKKFNRKVTRIITSPLLRTTETAIKLAESTGAELLIEDAIIETNHGRWEGNTKEYICTEWPEIYKKWQKKPGETAFPDGEDFRQTRDRVINWWKNLYKDGGATAIVTHDNVIRIVIANTLGMNLNDIWKLNLIPTAITTIEKDNDNLRLIELNNVNHLNDGLTDITTHAL